MGTTDARQLHKHGITMKFARIVRSRIYIYIYILYNVIYIYIYIKSKCDHLSLGRAEVQLYMMIYSIYTSLW